MHYQLINEWNQSNFYQRVGGQILWVFVNLVLFYVSLINQNSFILNRLFQSQKVTFLSKIVVLHKYAGEIVEILFHIYVIDVIIKFIFNWLY
jgi:hypothetical protein